jgi:hypothetical protein
MKKIIIALLMVVISNAYSQFENNNLKYFNTKGVKQIIERKYSIKDTVTFPLAIQTYDFNSKGRIVKVNFPKGETYNKIEFGYDDKNNLLSEKYYKNDLSANYINYEYEKNILQSIIQKDRNDDLISSSTYKYNSNNRLTGIVNEEFKYSSEYYYSGNNCYKIKLYNSSKIVKTIDMNYDKNGNLETEAGSFMYSGDKNSKSYNYYKKSYKYDDKNRLIEMNWDNNGVNFDTYKYFYDNDNLIKWERTDALGKLNYRTEYKIIKY